jgi:hypothetical protein
MKKILKPILALTLLGALITSCTDESDLLIVAAKGEYAILTPTTGDAVELSAATPSNPGLSLSWAKADYGVTPTVITYVVEIDKTGDNFDTPVVLTSSTDLFATVNSEMLNGAALSIGLNPFEQGSMDIRIAASVGTPASDIKYSNVINYLVTPYSTDLPRLFVTGNFLSNSGYGDNWTPANGVPIASAGFGQTNYEGFVYINEASYAFLFLPTNSSFDNKYGDDGSFSGTLAANGSDITGTTTANNRYFYVKANTTTNTYSLQPTRWAITGSATPAGWPDNGVQDTDLTYNASTKKWEITLALSAGGNEFKFRANDGWDLNLGSDGPDADTSMDFGGGNLSVPAAGTYKISLDLSNPRDYQYSAVLQ